MHTTLKSLFRISKQKYLIRYQNEFPENKLTAHEIFLKKCVNIYG